MLTLTPQAQSTVAELKAAMASKGDFPSVSTTLSNIVTSMKSEGDSDEQLINAVLGDFALTNKVLRLANSSMYSAFGGEVTTVSMAVFILGTETLGHLAMGVKLLDDLGSAAASESARMELSKAAMAGAVARKVGTAVSVTEGEAVSVAALLRSLGKLLVCFYLPAKFSALEAAGTAPDADDEAAACVKALGLTYSQIAMSIGEQWGLPPSLTDVMSDAPAEPGTHKAWVRSVATYSLDFITAVSSGASEQAMADLATKFADAVGLSASDLAKVAVDAFNKEGDQSARNAVTASAQSAQRTLRTTTQKLVVGLGSVIAAEKSLKPPQLTGLALEVMWSTLDCTRAMFFLRKPANKSYELVLGHGADVPGKLRKVAFEEAFSPNVFHIVLSNATPVYLANTQEPNIARRIPAWFTNEFAAVKSMLLLPVGSSRHPIGLICLDWGVQGRQSPLSEVELSYVEQLRTAIERSLTAPSLERRGAQQLAHV